MNQKGNALLRKNTYNFDTTQVLDKGEEKIEKVVYQKKEKYDRKYSVNYQNQGVMSNFNKNIYNSNHLDMEMMTKSYKTKAPNRGVVFQES